MIEIRKNSVTKTYSVWTAGREHFICCIVDAMAHLFFQGPSLEALRNIPNDGKTYPFQLDLKPGG